MSKISKKDLTRGMGRAQEFRASSTDADANAVFDTTVAHRIADYVAAESAEVVAKRALEAARAGMATTLAQVDQPFRYARAIVAASDPAAELPAPLSEAPTPTEAKVSLEELRGILAAHRGEAWADRLVAGPFGATSADAVAAIVAWGSATVVCLGARGLRMEAADALYPALLAFKEVLRQGRGEVGGGYTRLRTRARKTHAAAETTPVTVPAPAPATKPRPTNGAASAPMLSAPVTTTA